MKLIVVKLYKITQLDIFFKCVISHLAWICWKFIIKWICFEGHVLLAGERLRMLYSFVEFIWDCSCGRSYTILFLTNCHICLIFFFWVFEFSTKLNILTYTEFNFLGTMTFYFRNYWVNFSKVSKQNLTCCSKVR